MNKLTTAALTLAVATTVNAQELSPEVVTLLDEVAQKSTLICIWDEIPLNVCFNKTFIDVTNIRKQAEAECWEETVCLNGEVAEWLDEYIETQDKRIEDIAEEVEEALYVWT